MGRIFKLLSCVAALTIITLSAVSVSNAAGTDIVWKTKQILWSSTTADSQLIQTIGDETDTTRTQAISTGDWAWDAFVSGPATGTLFGARLTFIGLTNNAAAESLYYVPEFGINGKWSRFNGLSGAAGVCATSVGLFGITNPIYHGNLIVDPDAAPSATNIWLAPNFRLVVAGDVGGTTPSVSSCKIYLTYPTRRASQ